MEFVGYPTKVLYDVGIGRGSLATSSPSPTSFLPPPPDDYSATLSLGMICRGDEPGLLDAIGSVYDYCDEVVLGVNGTPAIAKKLRAQLSEKFPKVKVKKHVWEDDFAAARNFVFGHLTGDWLFWIDSDDIVMNPEQLKAVMYAADSRGWGCVNLVYNYRIEEGRPTVVQHRERLMKRSLGWSWKDRVHEYANADTVHQVGFATDVYINHYHEGDHSERNLRLLEMMEAENPDYPRMLVEMGDVHYSLGNYDTAIDYYTRYFSNAENQLRQWEAAVAAARTAMKVAQDDPEYWNVVSQWALAAIATHNIFSVPYIMMAHVAWWRDRDADATLRWLDDSAEREEAPLETRRNPDEYTINRWDVEHRALASRGEWAAALDVISKALVYTRFDPSWQWYGYLYMEANNCEKSLVALTQLVNHLCQRGDTLRALRLLEDCTPLSVREDKRFRALHEKLLKITAHVRDDDKYKEFYEEEHGEGDLNGIDVNVYRLEALDKALRARGAKRVLDVGCGAGGPAVWLAARGYVVVGLDINKHAIEAAKRLKESAERQGLIKKGYLSFREGSLETTSPADVRGFDAVVIMEVIEHVNPEKLPFMFASACDYLKEGGSVFMTTPNMLVGDIPPLSVDFPRDHVTEFTYEDLVKLVYTSSLKEPRRIWNLHKISEPHALVPGFGSWFLEYDKTPEADPTEPVVIYVGPGYEKWTPDTPTTHGLGGSETWAVETAKALRKKGHPVIVYAETEGFWDGVCYRHYSKFSPTGSAFGTRPALLIVSRFTYVLDLKPEADRVIFVAHDTDYGDEVTPRRFEGVPYYVLSDWHEKHTRELYPFLDVRRTFNGVNLEYFEGPAPERVPNSFIWSSSPDRGLDRLLEVWPSIKRDKPDATLDIYYGWDNIDKAIPTRPWLAPFKYKVLELLKQDGVKWHGRVGQRELAKAMQAHEFWVYPSVTPSGDQWNETFCITAVEAQLAGINCYVADAGALPERSISDRYFVVENPLEAVPEYKTPRLTVDPKSLTWEAAAETLLQ